MRKQKRMFGLALGLVATILASGFSARAATPPTKIKVGQTTKFTLLRGLALPDNQSSNLIGIVKLLDEMGMTRDSRFVVLNETGNQARREGIITVTKPTPFLLRVINDRDVTYTYDVTIDKAD